MLLTSIEIEKNMNQRFFEVFTTLKQLKLTSASLSTLCVSDSRQKSSINFRQMKFMFSSWLNLKRLHLEECASHWQFAQVPRPRGGETRLSITQHANDPSSSKH